MGKGFSFSVGREPTDKNKIPAMKPVLYDAARTDEPKEHQLLPGNA